MLETLISWVKQTMCCSLHKTYNFDNNQPPTQRSLIGLLTPDMLLKSDKIDDKHI